MGVKWPSGEEEQALNAVGDEDLPAVTHPRTEAFDAPSCCLLTTRRSSPPNGSALPGPGFRAFEAEADRFHFRRGFGFYSMIVGMLIRGE